MPLILPNDIANLQPADGDKVQQNFNSIETYVNQELIRRDGGVAMTGPLLLSGTPTQANQAVNKAYVDASGPVGSVIMYAGDTEPSGYMFCRGQAVSRSTYAALFTVIGTRFGTGNGTSTFNLPNYQATVPVGHNTGANPPEGLTDLMKAGVGQRGGQPNTSVARHWHTMQQSHTHDATHDHAQGFTQSAGSHTHGGDQGSFLQTSFTPVWYADTFPAADVAIGYGGTSADGSHGHVFQTPVRNLSTGANSAFNTEWAGADVAGNNYSPVLTINFLIKVS